MNPRDTAEAEVPQAVVKSRIPESDATQEKPSSLFQKAKDTLTGRRKSIFNALSTIKHGNPTVDLTPEQDELDNLASELNQLTEKTEEAVEENIPERKIDTSEERALAIDAANREAERLREEEIRRSEENREVRNNFAQVESYSWRLQNSVGDSEHQQQTLQQALDWLSETPERAELVGKLISDQEKVVAVWLMCPKLNDDEKNNIEFMRNTLNMIRNRLREKGRAMDPPLEMGGGNNDYGEASIPTNPDTEQEYAHHFSPIKNAFSIAEKGLIPSGSGSKEEGTVFFGPHKGMYAIEPFYMLYRTHLSHIPEFADHVDENGRPKMGDVGAIRRAVPSGDLEFSLDLGKSWRKDMTPLKE